MQLHDQVGRESSLYSDLLITNLVTINYLVTVPQSSRKWRYKSLTCQRNSVKDVQPLPPSPYVWLKLLTSSILKHFKVKCNIINFGGLQWGHRSIPSLKRMRRLGFPRYLVNHFDASSPSSKAEPDHSHTETPSATSDGSTSGTFSTSIPGALITVRKGEVDSSEVTFFCDHHCLILEFT